jgi:Co/Zn/Cd efflux system component
MDVPRRVANGRGTDRRSAGHINVDDLRAALLEMPHVSNVHDFHVGTITSGFVAL